MAISWFPYEEILGDEEDVMRAKRRKRSGRSNWDVAEKMMQLAVALALLCAFVPAVRTYFFKLLQLVGLALAVVGGMVVVLSVVFLLARKRRRKVLQVTGCAPSDAGREMDARQPDGHFVALSQPWIECEIASGAQAKGNAGENRVAECLRQGLPSDLYFTIRDIYLPVDGATTQIDEIVVSTFGVFVVEVKNYSGWILANDRSEWVQSMRGGKKFRFQNPIRQNYRHRCVLAECTGIPLGLIESVVVFAGSAEFKGDLREHPEKYRGVVHVEEAVDYIRSFSTPRIKPVQVPEIVEAIKEWQSSISPAVIEAHVENLRRKHLAAKERLNAAVVKYYLTTETGLRYG